MVFTGQGINLNFLLAINNNLYVLLHCHIPVNLNGISTPDTAVVVDSSVGYHWLRIITRPSGYVRKFDLDFVYNIQFSITITYPESLVMIMILS